MRQGKNLRVRVQEPGTAYYMPFKGATFKTNGHWLEVRDAQTDEILMVYPRDVVTYLDARQFDGDNRQEKQR